MACPALLCVAVIACSGLQLVGAYDSCPLLLNGDRRCDDGFGCYYHHHRCDGVRNCLDGSDEDYCGLSVGIISLIVCLVTGGVITLLVIFCCCRRRYYPGHVVQTNLVTSPTVTVVSSMQGQQTVVGAYPGMAGAYHNPGMVVNSPPAYNVAVASPPGTAMPAPGITMPAPGTTMPAPAYYKQ